MNDQNNPYVQEQVAMHGSKLSDGKLLVVMLISGVIIRFAGTFFVMNYKVGDATYQCPAVLLKDGTPKSIDPRCLVFDNGTLARFWTPRNHFEDLDPTAQRWLEDNGGYAKQGAVPSHQPREVEPDRSGP